MKVIKTILISLGVLLLVGVISIVAIIYIVNNRNENYWKYESSNEIIEAKYIPLGNYETDYYEESIDNICSKYEIYYPKDIKESNEKYPVVIMANGTGVKASSYKTVFKHLASWGFIVVGNEDENSRSGESSSLSLDFILYLNENNSSIFYNKVDIDNIGIAGHSQGGVGAINAVTKQANGNKYKAIWTASTTSRYHANELGEDWSYDTSLIKIPYFMVAGTLTWDAGSATSFESKDTQGICPLWSLKENYDKTNSSIKIMARRKDKDHSDMLKAGDSYMTAWFIYHLKKDISSDFFSGENAEILTNSNWQDVNKNI